MPHPVLVPDAVAVVTGGASGIGLAAARRFKELGLAVVVADRAGLAGVGDGIVTIETDVADRASVEALAKQVHAQFGHVDVLMNNAGISPASTALGPLDAWEQLLGVNLWGVIHGAQAFVPKMLERGKPGLVINTGSKQGITTPPGNPAYNVSKAGVKAFTEALEHELRNQPFGKPRISAHLLIPGFVFTGLTARRREGTEKPAGAWTPAQTVDFMLASLEKGDFYILCPDNEVPRALDEKRIQWAAGDIVENRPPLSRWHPDWTEKFNAFVKAGQ